MTTIVCNREVMAADSRASDDAIKFPVTKIHRVGALLVGFAGDLAMCTQLISVLKRTEPSNLMKAFRLMDLGDKNVCLLILAPTGIWVYEGEGDPYQVKHKFMAIGSGAQAALAAMQCGCSPQEAVRVAKSVDPGTGGRIRSMRLTPN